MEVRKGRHRESVRSPFVGKSKEKDREEISLREKPVNGISVVSMIKLPSQTNIRLIFGKCLRLLELSQVGLMKLQRVRYH